MAAVSGGALFPALTGLLADKKGYHIAMIVPLIGFFVAFAFPIYLNTVCAKELDGFSATKIGYEGADLSAEKREDSMIWEEKGTTGADAHHLELEESESRRRHNAL